MFKDLGLKGRLLLLSLVPTGLMALMLGSYFSWMQLQALEQHLLQRGEMIIEQLAPLSAAALSRRDVVVLNRIAVDALEQPDVRSVSFLASDRQRLAHAGPKMINPEPIGDLSLLTQLTANDATRFLLPVFGRHHNLSDQPHQLNAETLLGWVEIELSHQGTLLHGYRSLLTSLLLIGAGLSITALLALRLSESINSPLNRIYQSVNKISQGQLDTRLPPLGSAELDNLAYGINRMAESLQNAQDELQQSVDQATEDVRQNLETIEIQNIELDLARKEALEASRIKSEFLANMSHEIRTPLNGIIGFTKLLQKSELSPRQQDYLNTIENSADGLLGIINEILDFSKIEAGKLVLDSIPFNLRDLLQETLTLLAPTAHQKQLELISLIYRDTPLSVSGDPQRLKQVLTNLISNAIKFTSEGHVLVRTMAEDESDEHVQLRISVQDTGIGLSAPDLENLFSAFSQADNSNSRHNSGTGLGLVISKRLIEQMGGQIGVESKAGEGSEFWITITLAKALDDASETPQTAFTKHAAVFEISELATRALTFDVEDCGFKVKAFADLNVLTQFVSQSLATDQPISLVVIGTSLAHQSAALMRAQVDELEALGCKVLVLCPTTEINLYQHDLPDDQFVVQAKPLCTRNLRRVLDQLLDTPKVKVHLPQPASRPNILCVDDNPANLLLVKTLLSDMHANVTAVESGYAALEAVETHRFDLIFMDVQMPGMNGHEATLAIRRYEASNQLKPVPIIALTAHALANEKRALLQAGMDDYLTKPINERQLSDVILKWTGKRVAAQVAEAAETLVLPILDMQEGLKLAAGKADLAQDMLSMLLSSLIQDWQSIQLARQNNDRDLLIERVHRLNGATRYCGVPQLREACQRAETLLKQNLPDVQRALDELEQAIEALLAHTKTQQPNSHVSMATFSTPD